MPAKRVLITAGGTGGHLFPAQALAQKLMKRVPSTDVLFVAGGLATNRYFDRHRFPFQEIASSPIKIGHPLKMLKGVAHLFKGFRQAIAILKNYRPDVVVGFGSYYTVPIVLAARYLKIPIILHEANSIPGRANQWLAAFATCVGIHFPSTAPFFKGKTVEVGLPLREGFQLNAVSKDMARAYYQLSCEKQTLLIFGGSQGSRAINQSIAYSLPHFKRLSLQVIHLTGNRENVEALKALYAENGIPASVKTFEDQMQMAWSAADGFIGRSGASTIAEAIEFEVPGILIPYPFATDQHQDKNADFLVKEVGAAWKFTEDLLDHKTFGEHVEAFFHDQNYDAMKKAFRKYKERPDQQTLDELIQLGDFR